MRKGIMSDAENGREKRARSPPLQFTPHRVGQFVIIACTREAPLSPDARNPTTSREGERTFLFSHFIFLLLSLARRAHTLHDIIKTHRNV